MLNMVSPKYRGPPSQATRQLKNWGIHSSADVKINLQSSILQKNNQVTVPSAGLVSKNQPTKASLPTGTGHCCPGYNHPGPTVHLIAPSAIHSTNMSKSLPLTRHHARDWGNTEKKKTGEASVLLQHFISAAYMLCELGQGPKLFCASYPHLKDEAFVTLATQQGYHKDELNEGFKMFWTVSGIQSGFHYLYCYYHKNNKN